MTKRSVWGVRHAIKQAHVAKWVFKASLGACSLSLYAAMGMVAAPMAAHADEAAAGTHTFKIEAQSLSSALVQLALQSNSVISAHSDVVQGLSSAPLAGDYTVDAALRILLSDTNLVYEVTPAGASILQASSTQAADDGTVQLQPIYISGERTERTYLETFTSVGVATQYDIETYKFDELEDVFSSMANVRANPANGGNNGFQIRGLNADGVTQPANSAGLISVIIDGVTQSAEGLKRGVRGLWDVKQVEVLRGPQSTLQGRNALAGAVIIETNDPTYEFEVGARLLVGNLDQKEGGFVISGPIIDDQLAFRVSGEFQEHTKETTFIDAGNEPLGEDRYRSLRAKVLLEPSAVPDLSVLVSASHVYDQPATNTVDGPNYFDRVYAGGATYTEFRRMEVDNYAAHISYDVTDDITFHSISAINNTDLRLQSAPASTVYFRDDSRQDKDFTQDIYVEVKPSGNGLSGVLGLFYGDFEQEVASSIDIVHYLYGLLTYQNGTILRETETRAVYADLRYRVNDWATLLAGGRFQSDKVHSLVDIASDVNGPTFNDGTAEFEVFLPKGGVAFDLTDTQTIALTVSKGYRQGFTEVQAGTTSTINKVDPEFQWTYEVAYRDEQFDGLTFGVNVFYNEYTNQQVAIYD
ncbi:MAG: TonB-dependent receptor, partial [Parvibaculaceae bacterium]|nr:TonB-dependent receptor [Parvibaculaceae bacterium]